LIANPSLFSLYALRSFYWSLAVRGIESGVPNWSELRARHAAEISRIDTKLSSMRQRTEFLREQNALRRQQLERFDRAFVALRRKLRAQTWQPLPPLEAISPCSNEKA